jgi:hypothetical protein
MGQKLLLRTAVRAMVLPVVQYLRFVQALVVYRDLLVVLVGTGHFPEKGRKLVGHFGDKGMGNQILESESFFFVGSETLPGEVLEVL